MSGFLRIIGAGLTANTGTITMRDDELLGAIHLDGDLQTIIIYEDNAAGREITRLTAGDEVPIIMYGPFEHASKTIYYTLSAGVANLWAWKDAAGRRHNF